MTNMQNTPAITVSSYHNSSFTCFCEGGTAEPNQYSLSQGLEELNLQLLEKLQSFERLNALLWFARIYVQPEYRSKGIGRALLKTVMQEAKTRRCAIVCYINPYGELTYKQLRDFYCGQGFVIYNLDQENEVLIYIPS